jgi:trehalose-6-phosphate synthase
MTLGIPGLLYNLKIKLPVNFYFHGPFPCLSHLSHMPEILNYKSVMHNLMYCDCIFFQFHQNCNNFLRTVRALYLGEITYELNGYISILCRGRKVYVRVLRHGVDKMRVGICGGEEREKKML